jgi:predicted nucleic acid-binding protein
LSELTKTEFASTIWKRVRTKEISAEQAQLTLGLFESDLANYNFVTTDSLILEQARNLVTKYGREGLRTLDSVQLSTCISLKNEVDVFYTADKLLKALINQEGLATELPS